MLQNTCQPSSVSSITPRAGNLPIRMRESNAEISPAQKQATALVGDGEPDRLSDEVGHEPVLRLWNIGASQVQDGPARRDAFQPAMRCLSRSGYQPVNFTAPTRARTIATMPARGGTPGT